MRPKLGSELRQSDSRGPTSTLRPSLNNQVKVDETAWFSSTLTSHDSNYTLIVSMGGNSPII